jgi:hypothetical protein
MKSEMDEFEPQVQDIIKAEEMETQQEPPTKKRKPRTAPKNTEKWTNEQTKFLCTLRKEGKSFVLGAQT